ncbi:MAG TPA: hypothetical protein VIM05_09290 [Gaiellaceae bacterium]
MVTTPAPPAAESPPDPEGGDRIRPSMVEAIMDNLLFVESAERHPFVV